MLKNVKIRILDKRLGSTWPIPNYETKGSAAMDLRACVDEPITLLPQASILVPTGLSIHIENSNYCAKILPRSGLGHKHGIILGNSTGLIDSDYQGPLMVSCLNRKDQPYTIHPGDRIAQLIFIAISRPALEVVSEFNETDRGEGGFGSTGNK